MQMIKQLVLAAGLAGLGMGCDLHPPAKDKAAPPLAPAPEAASPLAAKTVEQSVYMAGADGVFSLAALKGQVVVLDFCAPWSPVASGRIQELNQLFDQQGTSGVAVVGMVVDAAPGSGVPAEWQQAPPRYPLVATPRGALTDYGAVRAVPSLLIADRQGRIRHQHHGFVAVEQVNTEVAALLNE